MSVISSNPPVAGRGAPRVRGERFFYRFAIALTVTVFAGFILNAIVNFSEFDRFTSWIALHGLFSAGWYLLLINQLRLVRAGKLAAHKQLGAWSLVLAVAIVVSGVVMTLDLYHFILASEDFDLANPEHRSNAAGAIGGTFLQWTLFSILYALGILNRRKPKHHKRFMLASSIQMAPAAFSRLLEVAGLPGFGALPMMLALYIVIMIYDWRTERRVHWSTLLSTGLFLLLPIIFFTAFSAPWFADLVIDALGTG